MCFMPRLKTFEIFFVGVLFLGYTGFLGIKASCSLLGLLYGISVKGKEVHVVY